MAIEQIFEFEFGGLGLVIVGLHVLLYLVIFMTKQKSVKENLWLDYYLLRKYRTRLSTLLSLAWAKLLTEFSPKMQDFKRVLD